MAEASQSLGAVQFGPFELSLDTQELRKHGLPLKLTGQAIQILVMLTGRPGQLITREELQQKLWPGIHLADDNKGLNAAINKLRETLGDSATTPTYVETLQGRGYRFITEVHSSNRAGPPVEGLDLYFINPPERKLAPLEPPKHRHWHSRAGILVSALTVAAVSLYAWLEPPIGGFLRRNKWQHLSVVPLTSSPGNVWSPTFSPDGNQVAFIWNDAVYAKGIDLYVKMIGNDKRLRLTNGPLDVYRVRPAWSPDGKNIALCHVGRESASGIFLISPLGGPERKISSTNCYTQFGSILSRSADGKQLAFLHHPADSPSDGTVRMSVLTLASSEEVPVKTDCNVTQTPAFSPRGDYLAWTCADNMSDVSINLKRLSDGKVTQLLRGMNGIGGLAWSGDARRLVFTTSFTGGDLWEVALGSPNRPERLPFGHDATDVAVSWVGNRLAFKQDRINANIWRFDLSQPQAHPEKVVASSRQQESPNYSPDGTQIAFESNRSGSYEVWVSDADGANAMQLTSFGINLTGTPRWSADGKLIAFDSRVGGEANLYLVQPNGGVPQKLKIDVRGNSAPSWSHDDHWIYFVNGADTRSPSIWKVPSTGGYAVQLSKAAAAWPLESPDGQYVYFSRNGWIWRVRSDGKEEQQVEGLPQVPGANDGWYPFGSGIYFLAVANHKAEIDFFDLDTKKSRQILVLDKAPPEYMGGLTVSRDGRWLLISLLDEGSSDLMMVENWQ